jgi:hypothetical protein
MPSEIGDEWYTATPRFTWASHGPGLNGYLGHVKGGRLGQPLIAVSDGNGGCAEQAGVIFGYAIGRPDPCALTS